MKLLHFCLLSLVFILLGCVQYKKYPFLYDKNNTIDSRLSGTWEINIQKTNFQKLFGEDKLQDNDNNIIITLGVDNYCHFIFNLRCSLTQSFK